MACGHLLEGLPVEFSHEHRITWTALFHHRFDLKICAYFGKFSTFSYHDLLLVYSGVNLFMHYHFLQQCHLFTLGSS